jgi:hypothetical protein
MVKQTRLTLSGRCELAFLEGLVHQRPPSSRLIDNAFILILFDRVVIRGGKMIALDHFCRLHQLVEVANSLLPGAGKIGGEFLL